MSDKEDEADYRIGYGKPPKDHRFAKGRSGNPAGRPRKTEKPKPINTEAAIMERLDNEIIIVNGAEYTRLELETITLRNKAAKGDLQAMRLLDRKRSALKLNEPASRGGVLVVPAAPSLEEWERRTAENQRQYREKTPLDYEREEKAWKAEEKTRPKPER
jgi:hypothetical protein